MAGVVIVQGIVMGRKAVETLQEIGEILLVLRTPLHFGQGGHARQLHILCVTERGDVFAPQVGLDTQDMTQLVGSQGFRRGIEVVHVIQQYWVAPGSCQRLLGRVALRDITLRPRC